MGKFSGDTAVTAIVVIAVFFFAFFVWPAWSGRDQPSWFVSVSVSPLGAGSVSPSGNVSVLANQSQTFTALASEGFSFDRWVFDGLNFGVQHQVGVPNQTVNSSHTLAALFVPINRVDTFEVVPSEMAFGLGSSSAFSFQLKNNGNFTASNIQMKLNDNAGVFESIPIVESVSGGSYFIYYTFKNCVNAYVSPYALTLAPFSSGLVRCGGVTSSYGGEPVGYALKSGVMPGVYNLSFSVTFVATGDYSASPYLVVPFKVTVLG
jgi:hypothetical protein